MKDDKKATWQLSSFGKLLAAGAGASVLAKVLKAATEEDGLEEAEEVVEEIKSFFTKKK